MGNRIARALRAALIILWVAALTSSALAASIPARINTSTKVYQYPSATSRWLPARANLSVTLTAASRGWARVSYKGYTGYVPLKYVTLKNPIRAYATANAKVYRTAGGSAMGTIPKGTTVYVVGVNGSYALVQNREGTVHGYIKGGQLSRSKPADSTVVGTVDGASLVTSSSAVPASLRSYTTSPGASKIEYVIYLAQNLVGAPYAASAKPPKTFDCAKFTYYCYSKARSGSLRGSSKSQGYDDSYSLIADISSLKRGDLVFFDTVEDDDLCDHVGIYIGGGYFIHASSEAKKVIVSNLNSGYYQRTFSWGRRIID